MAENDNQQYIYRWFINYFLLPLGRRFYTDWELSQSVEGIILLKSIYITIYDDFDLSKTSVQRYLNVIFPPLKCYFLKHLWYLMILGRSNNTTLRKRIGENIVKQKLGHKSYLLRYKESYIVATTEIEGA